MKNKLHMIVGIVIGIALIAILSSVIFLNKSYRNNEFVGTWDCKGVGKTAKGDNYVLTFKFDNNNKFIYGNYEELDKDSFKGTYEVKEKERKDNYTIIFKITNRNESESVKRTMNIDAVIKRKDNKVTATLTDEDDASYVCYLQTSKNPNLK